MEEISLAAKAYYKNCPNEIQQLAQDFFKSVGTDSKDRVSFPKFTNFFQNEESKYFLNNDSQECAKFCQWVVDSKFFTQLDTNGDGCLDFAEFLTFFYLLSTRHVWCSGCQANLPGLYFTCLDCFDGHDTTFDLCLTCYRDRRFSHHHSRFLDSFVLLRSKKRREVSRVATASDSINMEELSLAATAYYNNSSNEFRQLAWEFFQSIDTNREGRVSFDKFTHSFQNKEWIKYFHNGTGTDHYSSIQQYAKLCKWVVDSKFFTQLDTNGDGSLDFSEFLTFFYLVSTRHVWCSGCQANLPGLYFTCLECEDPTFDLCVACYTERRFSHHHSRFLDSFVLLRRKTLNNNGMDLFHNKKVVRLRSYHEKYIFADEDKESVIQSRNGSSENAAWIVEFVPRSRSKIRLKSCYGKYLTASDEPFLLGLTGKKVLQTLPKNLDSSVEWEPYVINGNQVLLKNRHGGSTLRANAGLPPWRNTVTHEVSSKSSSHDWVWHVDIFKEQEYQLQSETNRATSNWEGNENKNGQQKYPAPEQEDASRATPQDNNYYKYLKFGTMALEVGVEVATIAAACSIM